jgi:hypothetical protein
VEVGPTADASAGVNCAVESCGNSALNSLSSIELFIGDGDGSVVVWVSDVVRADGVPTIDSLIPKVSLGLDGPILVTGSLTEEASCALATAFALSNELSGTDCDGGVVL